MKIGMVVPGGIDRSGDRKVIPVLMALVRRLARKHDLHVFTLHQERTPSQWQQEGATITNIGEPNSLPKTCLKIVAEHRRGQFAILQSIWAGRPGASAVAAAAILRVPCVVHVAGGELISIPDIGYGGCGSWRGRVVESAVMRHATRITAASLPMINLIEKWGVSATRIPLGVDLERWPLRDPVRRNVSEPLRIVHVASINPVKDQTTLLVAAARLAGRGHKFHLDIVGEDTLDGAIHARASELGLTRCVQFHGFLTQQQLRPLVEAAHLSVISSRHEAGPIVALEAAVAGVPSVGTAVGHIAEWAPDAALAVPCGNPDALAEAIESILGDEDLRLRLATEAQRRAEPEDADHTASAFCALYEELTTAARRPPKLT